MKKRKRLDPDVTYKICKAFFEDWMSPEEIARRLKVSERDIEATIRSLAQAGYRAEKAAVTFKTMAVRLTERQYASVFDGGTSPVQFSKTRIVMKPDEADKVHTWIESELLNESDLVRAKALKNLQYKMRLAETRAKSNANWLGSSN